MILFYWGFMCLKHKHFLLDAMFTVFNLISTCSHDLINAHQNAISKSNFQLVLRSYFIIILDLPVDEKQCGS